MADYQSYLDAASSLAYRAGRITLGYFHTGVRPDFKADDTPVTIADRAAEEFLRGEIEKKFPTHAIVGEEFGAQGTPGNPFCWIIDPIDGTKSFVRGVPLYAVLIALEIEGVVRAGAAYFPALDEMLCAAEGLGCWWNGRRARVSEIRAIEQACICFTTWKHFARRDPGLFRRLSEQASMMRGWSDAYGYLLVATGRAEAMLDPAMAVWDCGPFPVLLSEAGGFFGDWQGHEGHTFGEGLATNAALRTALVALIGAGG